MKTAHSNFRWKIVGLLFFATTLNYIDRQVLGILKPFIQSDLGWSELDYGKLVMTFQIAYGLGLLLTGAFLDKLGNRIGYALAVGVWSIACGAHAIARTLLGFGVARFFLGIGEAANFPAAIKTVSEWFPKKERALATGLFNSGSNVGAFVAPIIVSFVTLRYGWQMAFVITGFLGLIWLVLWWILFRSPEKHPSVNQLELALIRSDRDANEEHQPLPMQKVLTSGKASAVIIAKAMTDWVWWFMLFWIPDLLEKMYHVKISDLTLPLIVIYTLASLGGIGGGWLSSHWIKVGRTPEFSRKSVMFLSALVVPVIILIPYMDSLWLTVAILSVATAAHQGWSSNLFTIVSDVFPASQVGSVISVAGLVAAFTGALSGYAVGWVLDTTASYFLIFLSAAAMYLSAWFICFWMKNPYK